MSLILSTNWIFSGTPLARDPLRIIGVKSRSCAPRYVDSTQYSAQKPVTITVSTSSSCNFSLSGVLLKEFPQVLWIWKSEGNICNCSGNSKPSPPGTSSFSSSTCWIQMIGRRFSRNNSIAALIYSIALSRDWTVVGPSLKNCLWIRV